MRIVDYLKNSELPLTADVVVYREGDYAVAIFRGRRGEDYDSCLGKLWNSRIVPFLTSIDRVRRIVFLGSFKLFEPIYLIDNVVLDFCNSEIIAMNDVGAAAMIYGEDVSNVTVMNVKLNANNIARRCLHITAVSKDISNIRLINVEACYTIRGYIWAFHVGSPYPHHVYDVYVDRLYVHDVPETYYDNVVFGRCINLELVNSRFENLAKNVLFYGGSLHRICNNYFSNVTKINIQSINTVFENNQLVSEENICELSISEFKADGSPDARPTYNVHIINNICINYKLDFEGNVYSCKFTKNRIIFDPADKNGTSYGIALWNYDNEVSDNYIEGAGRCGIYMVNLYNSIIKGNIIIDCGQNTSLAVRGGIIDFETTTPSYDNVITSNVIVGKNITIDHGIRIAGTHNVITCNNIRGVNYGIREVGSADYNLITNNIVQNYVTSAIATVGTSTIATNNITS